jgi:ribosomal protein S18 acetylase RimI-like enzyme
MYPEWRKSQAETVEQACRDPNRSVWVAEVDAAVAGFVACSFNHETRIGEVYMLAVDPAHQKQGIGATLNNFALERMREAGMALVEVSTGGDPGHAAARRSYERAGYTAFPLVLYYKMLEQTTRR